MSEIRDPIYGFIEPLDNELKVINTDVFQRLRRINQLAMAFLAYPGARHSRFEHSLGVFHIAGKIADKLIPEPDKRQLVRFSALLHDIGHGPFSHISEEVLNKYSVLPQGTAAEKIHEHITFEIIRNHPELQNLLSPDLRNEIVGLLSGKRLDTQLYRGIVSGPIDSDKMDYLLRDGYYCGVKYGIFDLDRMLNILTPVKEKDSIDSYLGIKSDGINTLEQYFLAKYYMLTQVYYHKIRRVTDAMIVRALELGIEKDGDKHLRKIYTFTPDESFINDYLQCWDDKLVCDLVYSKKNTLSKEIFQRLLSRNLFKNVFSMKIAEIPEIKEKPRDLLISINKNENLTMKAQLESDIAKNVLKCSEDFVIIKSTKVKSVKEMARDSEAHILIANENGGPPDTFEQKSTVFKAINEKLNDITIDVYAPVVFNDAIDKIAKKISYKDQIVEILQSFGGN